MKIFKVVIFTLTVVGVICEKNGKERSNSDGQNVLNQEEFHQFENKYNDLLKEYENQFGYKTKTKKYYPLEPKDTAQYEIIKQTHDNPAPRKYVVAQSSSETTSYHNKQPSKIAYSVAHKSRVLPVKIVQKGDIKHIYLDMPDTFDDSTHTVKYPKIPSTQDRIKQAASIKQYQYNDYNANNNGYYYSPAQFQQNNLKSSIKYTNLPKNINAAATINQGTIGHDSNAASSGYRNDQLMELNLSGTGANQGSDIHKFSEVSGGYKTGGGNEFNPAAFAINQESNGHEISGTSNRYTIGKSHAFNPSASIFNQGSTKQELNDASSGYEYPKPSDFNSAVSAIHHGPNKLSYSGASSGYKNGKHNEFNPSVPVFNQGQEFADFPSGYKIENPKFNQKSVTQEFSNMFNGHKFEIPNKFKPSAPVFNQEPNEEEFSEAFNGYKTGVPNPSVPSFNQESISQEYSGVSNGYGTGTPNEFNPSVPAFKQESIGQEFNGYNTEKPNEFNPSAPAFNQGSIGQNFEGVFNGYKTEKPHQFSSTPAFNGESIGQKFSEVSSGYKIGDPNVFNPSAPVINQETSDQSNTVSSGYRIGKSNDNNPLIQGYGQQFSSGYPSGHEVQDYSSGAQSATHAFGNSGISSNGVSQFVPSFQTGNSHSQFPQFSADGKERYTYDIPEQYKSLFANNAYTMPQSDQSQDFAPSLGNNVPYQQQHFQKSALSRMSTVSGFDPNLVNIVNDVLNNEQRHSTADGFKMNKLRDEKSVN